MNGFRRQTETRDKVALRIARDPWYIQNGSLWPGPKILLTTPGTITFRADATESVLISL